MALIVEDGTGKSDANAYCSQAFADAWHLARGITNWASMTTDERDAAIVRATAYLVQVYRTRWSGSRFKEAQALDWPRVAVPQRDIDGEPYVAHTVVPIEVQQACAELAFKAAAGDLFVDEGQAVKRKKVDSLEIEYQDGSSSRVHYAAIEALLLPYLLGGATSNSFRIQRA